MIDSDMYSNAFVALEHHGKDWALAGMPLEAMIASAEQMAIDPPYSERDKRNLSGFAQHFMEITGQQLELPMEGLL